MAIFKNTGVLELIRGDDETFGFAIRMPFPLTSFVSAVFSIRDTDDELVYSVSYAELDQDRRIVKFHIPHDADIKTGRYRGDAQFILDGNIVKTPWINDVVIRNDVTR